MIKDHIEIRLGRYSVDFFFRGKSVTDLCYYYKYLGNLKILWLGPFRFSWGGF